MRLARLIVGDGIGLRLNDGNLQLRQGDPIRLELRSPGYPVNVRIDYFTLDGLVVHLKPESQEPPPQLTAGATRVFWQSASGQSWNAGGAPFGSELISVIATPFPVELGVRLRVEQAADYLRDLRHALSRISVSSGQPNIVATLLVRTRP